MGALRFWFAQLSGISRETGKSRVFRLTPRLRVVVVIIAKSPQEH